MPAANGCRESDRQAARSCADLTKRLLGFARRQALDPKATSIADELTRLKDMVARLLGKAIKVDNIDPVNSREMSASSITN